MLTVPSRLLPKMALAIAAFSAADSFVESCIAASPKIGWAGSDINHVNASNASWSYNWWHTPPQGIANSNAEWIPLIKYGNNFQNKLDIVAGYNDVDTVLLFNEPEREDQSNISVNDVIALWPQAQATLPNHTLVSPAVSDNAEGQAWLADFMGQVEARNSNGNLNDDLRVDAVAFHWYGGSNPNNPLGAASTFLNRVSYYHNTYNRPVWITEFALHDWADNYSDEAYLEANRIFLEAVIPELESRNYVQRYAFYQHFTDATLLSGNSPVTPTNTGDAYVDTTMNGETFDLAGSDFGTDVRYLRGGTLVNNGASLGTSMRAIDSIEGNSLIGGSSDWGVGGNNAFVRIRTNGSLTKSGTNTVSWDNVEVLNFGDLNVNAGTLKITNGTLAGTAEIVVNPGGTLHMVSTQGRGIYTLVGQNIQLGGTLQGSTSFTAGSTLTTSGSAAQATSPIVLIDSTINVGGNGFTEFTPQVQHVTGGLNLDFNAALDTPGDNLWSSAVGTSSLNFVGAASPDDVSSPAFPGLTKAYSIPTSGGATGLSNYFESGGPRSRQDATFEVVFRVANAAANQNQVLLELGGLNSGVSFTLNNNQLQFNVDGVGSDLYLTTTLATGWHQAIGVIDLTADTDTISLYVNGVLAGSLAGQVIDDWAGGDAMGLGAATTSITGLIDGGSANNYHSLIAQARYYANTAFTPQQVTQNYQSIALASTPTGSVFTIAGDLNAATGSKLEFDIGDNEAADRIDIAGALSLTAATIEVSYVGIAGLTVGDTFNLLDFVSASGSLAGLSLPALAPQLMWDTSALLTTGEISITIAGDYNADGRVDAADYTVWRDGLGAQFITSADGNGDGAVNQADYAVWRANFGQTAASLAAFSLSPSSVPEPSAMGLAALLLTSLIGVANNCNLRKSL